MPIIALTVVTILGAIWVARDAKSRGMHAQRWALVMLLTSMIALPAYLVARKRHSGGPA